MNDYLRIPGLIDIHVHLRDPGQTDKEDFNTGTAAALKGGITTIFDMPNNLEPVFSVEKLSEKSKIVSNKALCDYGFFFGSDGENLAEFEKAAGKTIGLKLYLSDTTGKYTVTDESQIYKIFKKWTKKKPVVVHAENEKVGLAIKIAYDCGNILHITHITGENELAQIMDAKKMGMKISSDATPHHLFLSLEDKERLGKYAEVKPPLVSKRNQAYLWNHISDIDCIASDHAPHMKKEKESEISYYGMPGLETMLPLLITAFHDGKLTFEDIIRMTSHNPSKIFNLKRDDSSYAEINSEEEYLIENETLFTKCKWSPFAGWYVKGKIKRVFLRGTRVYEDGKILVRPGFGKNIK
jgi:dihydroorotase-like cyclic amidohydrolase